MLITPLDVLTTADVTCRAFHRPFLVLLTEQMRSVARPCLGRQSRYFLPPTGHTDPCMAALA